MSIAFPVVGVLEKPTTVALSTGAVTDIYTAPTTMPVRIIGLVVVNTDTVNACRVAVWYSIGGVDYPIYAWELAAGETETEGLRYPIHFDGRLATCKIKAQATTGGDLSVTVFHALVSDQVTK